MVPFEEQNSARLVDLHLALNFLCICFFLGFVLNIFMLEGV